MNLAFGSGTVPHIIPQYQRWWLFHSCLNFAYLLVMRLCENSQIGEEWDLEYNVSPWWTSVCSHLRLPGQTGTGGGSGTDNTPNTLNWLETAPKSLIRTRLSWVSDNDMIMGHWKFAACYDAGYVVVDDIAGCREDKVCIVTTLCFQWNQTFNTLRPGQNGRHVADDIFKCIFLNENVWIPIKISLKFVPKGPINNIPAMVKIMAWRRPGDKPLSEPMMVRLPTHICVTRPQWVNIRRNKSQKLNVSRLVLQLSLPNPLMSG